MSLIGSQKVMPKFQLFERFVSSTQISVFFIFNYSQKILFHTLRGWFVQLHPSVAAFHLLLNPVLQYIGLYTRRRILRHVYRTWLAFRAFRDNGRLLLWFSLLLSGMRYFSLCVLYGVYESFEKSGLYMCLLISC